MHFFDSETMDLVASYLLGDNVNSYKLLPARKPHFLNYEFRIFNWKIQDFQDEWQL